MVRKTKKPLSRRLWVKRLVELLEGDVHACKSCQSPVRRGYVCTFCDDNDPEQRYNNQTGDRTN